MTGVVRKAVEASGSCDVCSGQGPLIRIWEPPHYYYRAVQLCPDCIRFTGAALDETRFRRLVTRVKEWLRG